MQKGILTSSSAGNSGPDIESVSDVAPWMLTVGASSTDKRIVDEVVLGYGTTLVGSTVNGFDSNGEKFPLVDGRNVSSWCNGAVQ
ncbi:hypothetical protein GIB67_003436 [Kingdonia uniflora]|uniref:Uncharacterized protein n=1 Tax=Kingdonia uniflora TaxID=39325 RepID=A0A7J7P9T6_9MAGN|nr:hypothetical protein GIB67_003436 [Kingdonia uniflora]